jgi:AcrR family transcriptional regulator
VAARRVAIVDTAEAMLGLRPIAGISLRELAGEVGLAKSNVLRYFDSREAVFLEVLDRRWAAWLDEVEPLLRHARAEPIPYGRAIAVATAVADSLVAQPLLCELFSAMAGVLEHNISVEYARDFKLRAMANTRRLGDAVLAELPHLGIDGATHFAGAVVVVVSGLWPFARPSEAMARACAELGHPPAERLFPERLTEGLVNQLIGLCVRAA